jgi:hypothetical protein
MKNEEIFKEKYKVETVKINNEQFYKITILRKNFIIDDDMLCEAISCFNLNRMSQFLELAEYKQSKTKNLLCVM